MNTIDIHLNIYNPNTSKLIEKIWNEFESSLNSLMFNDDDYWKSDDCFVNTVEGHNVIFRNWSYNDHHYFYLYKNGDYFLNIKNLVQFDINGECIIIFALFEKMQYELLMHRIKLVLNDWMHLKPLHNAFHVETIDDDMQIIKTVIKYFDGDKLNDEESKIIGLPLDPFSQKSFEDLLSKDISRKEFYEEFNKLTSSNT